MRGHLSRTLGTATIVSVAVGLAGCSTAKDEPESKPTVSVVSSGFGQDGLYATAIVIATSSSPKAVGESVTATVNFKDAGGKIIKTEEQVESFTWVDQKLALPVQAALSDASQKVASIDVSVGLSKYGTTEKPRTPLPAVDTTEITPGQYGKTTAVFTLKNDTGADLKSARVGVACTDAAGKIIGGGSEYPELIAAGQSYRLEAGVIVSGTPSRCTAYPNYGSE